MLGFKHLSTTRTLTLRYEAIHDHFTRHFGNIFLLHILPPMPPLYIGETGRSFRSRFGEHLQHTTTLLGFLWPSISTPPVTVFLMFRCGLWFHAIESSVKQKSFYSWGLFSRKVWISTSASFELSLACMCAPFLRARAFISIWRSLTVLSNTEEGLYTRNVCLNQNLWRFLYFVF